MPSKDDYIGLRSALQEIANSHGITGQGIEYFVDAVVKFTKWALDLATEPHPKAES